MTAPDPLIQLVLRTTRVTPATLEATATAVQAQVREHLAPAWGVGTDVVIQVVTATQAPDPTA